VVEALDRILPLYDAELSRRSPNGSTKLGVTVHLGAKAKGLRTGGARGR
jgi:dihydrolipoamide dehydrogenase